MDSKGVIGIVLCGIGIGVMLFAASAPWYTIHDEGTVTLIIKVSYTADKTLYPDKWTSSVTVGTSTSTDSSDYYSKFPDAGKTPKVGDVHNTIKTMTLISVFLAIMGIVLIGLTMFNRIKGSIAGWLVILFSLMMMLTPIIYWLELPGAIAGDYSSANKENPCPSFAGVKQSSGPGYSLSTTCGPGTGWTLSFVSFVLVMLGGVVASRIEPASPTITTAPSGYYVQIPDYRP